MARDPHSHVRQKFEQSLGAEIGSLFSELWQELTYLHIVWREYRTLFGDTEESLKTLNTATGLFAYVIQKTLWECVLLYLARLTDPAQTGAKSNLSVRALPDLVRLDLRPEVERLMLVVLEKTSFARDWRNRYLAHKDLPLALGAASAPPLAAASRASVEEALEALRDLLNTVNLGYNQTTTAFRGLKPHDGAEVLLELLRAGLDAKALKEKELRKVWVSFDAEPANPT